MQNKTIKDLVKKIKVKEKQEEKRRLKIDVEAKKLEKEIISKVSKIVDYETICLITNKNPNENLLFRNHKGKVIEISSSMMGIPKIFLIDDNNYDFSISAVISYYSNGEVELYLMNNPKEGLTEPKGITMSPSNFTRNFGYKTDDFFDFETTIEEKEIFIDLARELIKDIDEYTDILENGIINELSDILEREL